MLMEFMSILYGIPSKILCFPENLVAGKISLLICYESTHIGIFRPFGTIFGVFEKSSAERSAEIPSFRVFQNPRNKQTNAN